MQKQVVKEAPLGQFLEEWFPDCSRSTIRSWIKVGRVLIDGKKATRIDQQLLPGRIVEIVKKQHKVAGRVKLLYRDSEIVVLDKPSGLLSVATEKESEDTLHALLKQEFKKIYVIHRLDQETSGVILFALTENAFHRLKQLFKEHSILREYEAIVEGIVEGDEGSWENYLWEDKQYKMHVTNDHKKGERAVTHWKVEGRSKGYTKLTLTLETGKKNQIRVQAAYAGHPVAGDKKYGAKLERFKRLALHAKKLELVHPVLDKVMKFTSKPPEWFH